MCDFSLMTNVQSYWLDKIIDLYGCTYVYDTKHIMSINYYNLSQKETGEIFTYILIYIYMLKISYYSFL